MSKTDDTKITEYNMGINVGKDITDEKWDELKKVIVFNISECLEWDLDEYNKPIGEMLFQMKIGRGIESLEGDGDKVDDTQA